MRKSGLRIIGLVAVYTLVLSVFQSTHPATIKTQPETMPPSPILEERIRLGLVQEPIVLTQATQLRSQGIDNPDATVARTGAVRALAVVVDFSDKVSTVTASYFDTLIFAEPVVGRGSVYDYFDEVSYEQVDIITLNLPSGLGWIRAPSTYSSYVGGSYCLYGSYPNNCQKLAEDIVAAIDSTVNFANYDNDSDFQTEPIMIIHAGAGAEYTGNVNDIWSHSWNLYNTAYRDGVYISKYVIMPEYWTSVSPATSDMTIGVFAHEMGHGFWGLPDLYDTTNVSEGIGNWSLMASGSWNGPGGNGSSPAWPDAWSRIQMGFISPTQITSNSTSTSFPKIVGETSLASVFKIKNNKLQVGEYFLFENRQKTSGSYDEYLPGSGLLVWQVDEAMGYYGNDYTCTYAHNYECSDSTHYLVSLKQADGLHQMESNSNRGDSGDPFPGSSSKTFWTKDTHPDTSSYYSSNDSCVQLNSISASASTMTAAVQVTCQLPPTNLAANRITSTRVDLTWTDSAGETGYRIDRSTNGGSSWSFLANASANAVGYSDTGAPVGTTYYYRVQAVNSDGGSLFTSPVFVVSTLLPPTGFSASAVANTNIQLAWTDTNAEETGYKIERSANGGANWIEIFTTAADAVSYTDLSPACGSYRYRVRATNGVDNSTYSANAAASIDCPLVKPSQPATSSSATDSITVSWVDLPDEDTYTLEKSSDGLTGWTIISSTIPANTTSYLDSGLACSTWVYYRLSAANLAGTSPVSDTAGGVTMMCAPASESLTRTEINVSWTDTDFEDAYQVDRYKDANGNHAQDAGEDWIVAATLPANTISFNDSGLTPNTIYGYRVSAMQSGVPVTTSAVFFQVTQPIRFFIPVVNKTP